MGHVLNEYWPKGANLLTDMLGIILRFRQYTIAIVGDIKKMYNAIELSYFDQHVHRFLWRDMNTDREPTHYKQLALSFGDRPSGAIAMMALRKTAEENKKEYPRAYDLIQNDSYADHLFTSVNSVDEAKQLIYETEKVLKNGGFEIKQWICSKACEIENLLDKNEVSMRILKPDYEKVLGIVWKPEIEEFRFQINVKLRVIEEDVMEINDYNATPRQLVSTLAGIYDPLGFVLPFVIEEKLLMVTRIPVDNIFQLKY